MTDVLELAEINNALGGTDWVVDGATIVLNSEHANFEVAWEFASRVAEAAEAANHHPDILVHGWNKSRITLSTHSAGGVTQMDIDLARAIDTFRA